MRVWYESMVDWQQYQDYVYCTPLFHGKERHDFVILKTTNGFIFAELLFIFTTSVAEHRFPICLVRPFDAAIQPRSKDINLRLRRLCPKSSTEFFFAQSIVRGAPLIPTFDNMSGDHFVMDIVDHNGDLFVRCNEIFGRQCICNYIPSDPIWLISLLGLLRRGLVCKVRLIYSFGIPLANAFAMAGFLCSVV
ncbi:hypothetical protein EDB85DRAFT_1866919 [Lactarius pseudohatsudake]|nr:hypothetical protein EDB85DRAFT_1866919 [Lactarius pseudohatsudake]